MFRENDNKRDNNKDSASEKLLDYAKKIGVGVGVTGGISAGSKLLMDPLQKKLIETEVSSMSSSPKDVRDAIKLKRGMGFKGDIYAADRSDSFLDFLKSKGPKDETTLKAAKNKIYPLRGNVELSITDAVYNQQGPHYLPLGPEGYVASPISNKQLLAHELGHGTGKNFLVKSKVGQMGRNLGMSNLLNAATLGAFYDKNKSLKDQDSLTKLQLGSTALSSLGAASVLGEEARASVRGARYLKRMGMGNYKDAIKQLGPGYASYVALLGAAPYGAYKLSGKLKESIIDKKKDKKDKDKID